MASVESFGFVINPHAGRRKSGEWQREIQLVLRGSGVRSEMIETGEIHGVERSVKDLLSRHSAVIAVGGDGTAHTVAQPMIGSGIPFGLLPNGSGNDFSRVLGMPKGVGSGLRLLLAGSEVRSLNALKVTVTEADTGDQLTRWAINTTGFGFDAAVSRMKTRIPVLKGLMLYLSSSLVTLAQYRASRMTIEAGGTSESFRGLMIAAGVGKFEGGGFKVFPDASTCAESFEVCEVREGSTLRALPLLVRAVGGYHTGSAKVRMSKQTLVSLKSDRPVPVHADGEVITERGVEVKVVLVEKAFSVLVPA